MFGYLRQCKNSVKPVNWVSIANGTFRASPQGLSKVQKEQVMDKSNNKLLLD